MFERFNDRALRVLARVEEESRRLCHHRAGTDDFLRALVMDGDGVAAAALESLGVSPGPLLEHLDQFRGRGGRPPPAGPIPFTDGIWRALELAAQEAVYLGHGYVGTEHLLLGLLRGEGDGARILAQHGVDLCRASWRVQELLDWYRYGWRQAD